MQMLEGLNNGSKESKGEQKGSRAEQRSRWSSVSSTVGAFSTTAFQLQQVPHARQRILEADDNGPAAVEGSAATSVLQRSAEEAGAEGLGEALGPWWQGFLQVPFPLQEMNVACTHHQRIKCNGCTNEVCMPQQSMACKGCRSHLLFCMFMGS